MREDLVGYLLGALEADEQQRIERALAADPHLRRELERLRRILEPLEEINQPSEPPAGLAERTCDLVAGYAAHQQKQDPAARTHAAAVTVDSPHRLRFFSPRYSLADMLVLALVFLVAFTLFLPALVSSRFEARKLACQENLRMLGVQLTSFSDHDAGRCFPYVPLSGNRAFAGVFAPMLLDSELIGRTTRWLVCPGSPVADQQAERHWYVPTLEEIDSASGRRLARLQSQAAGSYAYSIGYFGQDGYRANRNAGRSFFALVSDAPSRHLRGRVSANHGGLGQNICFEDGHVRFVTNPQAMALDDPLRNRLGFVGAGVHRDDAVLLNSAMHPNVDHPLAPIPTLEQQADVILP